MARPAPMPTKPSPAPSPKETPAAQEVVNYELEMRKLNNLISLGSKDADAFYNRGYLHAYKGDPQMAEKDYTQALVINKEDADAYYNRGLVYLISPLRILPPRLRSSPTMQIFTITVPSFTSPRG
jgi:tetratricopeptide (TPR) repeat protein